jgi:hypothetical protein
MEIETLNYLYRVLLFGTGMLTATLLRWCYPTVASTCSRWIGTILDRVTPGRKLGRLSHAIETIAEEQKRTNSDISDIRNVLVSMLDAKKEKVARPFRTNGLAANQE